MTINSDDYDEKYIKTKFSSVDNVPLKKTVELHNMTINFRSVFIKATNTIHNAF